MCTHPVEFNAQICHHLQPSTKMIHFPMKLNDYYKPNKHQHLFTSSRNLPHLVGGCPSYLPRVTTCTMVLIDHVC